jgi:hypothetical protein
MKTLSHIENFVLKTNIYKMEESHTRLTNKVVHLQAFIDELHEEDSPLQEDNNLIFDEYHTLK